MRSIELTQPGAKGTGCKVKRLSACLVLVTMTCTWSTSVKAQTFAEWWSQKSTQKKYLIQQIAALQVYTTFLQKGYGIVKTGLNTVKNITNGEFQLHTAYINSLKAVNPAVRNDPRVDAVVSMQTEIVEALNGLKRFDRISLDNRAYVQSVSQLIVTDCSKDLDELALVITAGKLQMRDDERIRRLNMVYESTQDKYAFTQSFCNEVAIMNLERNNEQRSVDQLRRYYESN